MKLYAQKIDLIAADVIRQLVGAGDIEVSDASEAELDVQAVLKEYLRVDRELTERAKDIMEIRGLPYSAFGRTKRALAEQRDFGLGEEGLSWIATQLIETFMQSAHIDEIYADDATLRRKIKEILRRHMALDEELDQEVRERIKNLEEGTNAWEIEYKRVMDQMKQKHGIKE
ncbi:MAG: DUF507 family protein [Deltaproteobacteria bacterium]|nr:MAG: DUF507 family protein [Deltaproteobacteria bacterium]